MAVCAHLPYICGKKGEFQTFIFLSVCNRTLYMDPIFHLIVLVINKRFLTILLNTRMTTDHTGLHPVLLPLLIHSNKTNIAGE